MNQTDARGFITTLGYDDLNRLTGKLTPGPAAEIRSPDGEQHAGQATQGGGRNLRR